MVVGVGARVSLPPLRGCWDPVGPLAVLSFIPLGARGQEHRAVGPILGTNVGYSWLLRRCRVLLSITRGLSSLALSFRREGAPVSYKLPLCVPVPESFRRVTYYTCTSARSRSHIRTRPVSSAGELILKNQEKERGILLARDYCGFCSGSGRVSMLSSSSSSSSFSSSSSLFLPRFDQFSWGEKGRHARSAAPKYREIYGGRRIVVTRSTACFCNTHAAAHAKQVCLCAR